MNKSLSSRGNRASKTIMRVDMDVFFEAVDNQYNKEDNPTGVFPLNMAENRLTWDMLSARIKAITQEKDIPEWVAGYTSGQGHPSFRAAVARFLTAFLTKCPMDENKFAFSAGATSVIEMTALVLGDAGDVMAFCAPSYPVYKQDIGNIAGLERYDIITHHDISDLKNGLILEIAHLEATKKDIESQGKRFKALVLTTPDNPTGGIYTYEKLVEIADWCITNETHLIVNEIYGLSLIDTAHPAIRTDYDNPTEFVSFAQIMETKKNDYLHYWYAFSKDFGVSGFRVGLVYSHNELFIQAYENWNYSHLVSNYTQWILEEVLSDHVFVKTYIEANQKALTEAYVIVVNALKLVDIPYVPSYGSLFIWLDLSEFLEENTAKAEQEFWLELYHKSGVLLTPGDGFGHTKRGLFRMVYPFISPEYLSVAMQKMTYFIIKKRN